MTNYIHCIVIQPGNVSCFLISSVDIVSGSHCMLKVLRDSSSLIYKMSELLAGYYKAEDHFYKVVKVCCP